MPHRPGWSWQLRVAECWGTDIPGLTFSSCWVTRVLPPRTLTAAPQGSQGSRPPLRVAVPWAGRPQGSPVGSLRPSKMTREM